MLANSTVACKEACKNCWQITTAVKTAVSVNSTIWKVNRTKQSLVFNDQSACKTAVLANSTIWKAVLVIGRSKVKQTVKTAVLANSTIWKANRTKQSLVKTAVLANSTIWKVNRTKQKTRVGTMKQSV